MKKKLLALFIIGMTLFTACGGDSKQGLNKEEKVALENYKEWEAALKLSERDDFPIAGFSDEAGITVEFEKEYGVSINRFAEIASEHNAFIEENPGYFSGSNVVLKKIADSPSGYEYMFSNTVELMGYGLEDKDFSPDSEQLTVAFVDASNDRQGSTPLDFANDVVRTLVVDYRNQGIDAQTYDFSYIDSYANLENIVYSFSEADNFDAEVFTGRIANEHSGLSVFVFVDGERVK